LGLSIHGKNPTSGEKGGYKTNLGLYYDYAKELGGKKEGGSFDHGGVFRSHTGSLSTDEGKEFEGWRGGSSSTLF